MSKAALSQGSVQKLKGVLNEQGIVQYTLPVGDTFIELNQYLGQRVRLEFLGIIQCIYCGKSTKKSFNQGYCFPCANTLARCDFCIIKPEKCHFHLGTCREPKWGEKHCFIPHIVYLANTSGIKVGITRETQIPTRWIDQGAKQALPIFRVQDRYQSGLVEVSLKNHYQDKTNWRKMLQEEGETVNLELEHEKIVTKHYQENQTVEILEPREVIKIKYPILEYPNKIQSLSLEKTPVITGTLLGIKGQYLLLDIGVINVRNITGYQVSVQLGENILL